MSPQAKPHSPGGTGNSAKSTFPSCPVGSNGILILLQEREGGTCGWAAVTGSTQAEAGRGRRRQQPQEEGEPLRRKSPETHRQHEDSKTREQTDSSWSRRQAAAHGNALGIRALRSIPTAPSLGACLRYLFSLCCRASSTVCGSAGPLERRNGDSISSACLPRSPLQCPQAYRLLGCQRPSPGCIRLHCRGCI